MNNIFLAKGKLSVSKINTPQNSFFSLLFYQILNLFLSWIRILGFVSDYLRHWLIVLHLECSLTFTFWWIRIHKKGIGLFLKQRFGIFFGCASYVVSSLHYHIRSILKHSYFIIFGWEAIQIGRVLSKLVAKRGVFLHWYKLKFEFQIENTVMDQCLNN